MSVHNITKDNFRQEVLESTGPVIVDFWAPWCGPCRMVGPILEEIAAERPDVKICKVNVDEEFQLAAQYRVVSIPTLLFLQDGEEVDKIIGARPKNQILEMLE